MSPVFSDEDNKVARALVELLSGGARGATIDSFEALMGHLSANQLEAEVKSWRSRGDPLPLRCDQLEAALSGTQLVETLAAHTDIPAKEVADRLSFVLPKVVREVSPFGTDESPDAAQFHLEGLRKRLRK